MNGNIGDNGLSEQQKQLILKIHNHYRSNVFPISSNMLKLEWDNNLEKITNNFVDKCETNHNKQRHQLYDEMVTKINQLKFYLC